MKPVKTLLPFSRWLLRAALLTWLILQNASTIQSLDFKSQSFFLALAFILFGLLLFAGGFSSKPSLTVISAIFLSLLFIYQLYLNFVPWVTQPQVLLVILLSVCIYFMSSANK
ncbi:MAG: hypothetical protein WCQ70_07970 [Lentimicrobiaceae bacterium]